MRDLFVVKLGGSLISDKAWRDRLHRDRIEALGGMIGRMAGQRTLVVIVGGGAVGHHAAKALRVDRGLDACDRLGLHAMSVSMFALKGEVAAAIGGGGTGALPLHELSIVSLDVGGRPQIHPAPLRDAIERGFVPVVSGGLVFDPVRGVRPLNGDLLALAVHRCGIGAVRRFVMLSDVAGLLDRDGAAVPLLFPSDMPDAKRHLRCLPGHDVTGGMEAKLDAALDLASRGVECVIASGLDLDADRFHALLDGREAGGTRILPS